MLPSQGPLPWTFPAGPGMTLFSCGGTELSAVLMRWQKFVGDFLVPSAFLIHYVHFNFKACGNYMMGVNQ